MTRIAKKQERRSQSPRKHKKPSVKSGPKKDKLSLGYKVHANAVSAESGCFIPKIK